MSPYGMAAGFQDDVAGRRDVIDGEGDVPISGSIDRRRGAACQNVVVKDFQSRPFAVESRQA
jgi:hypothetical protein